MDSARRRRLLANLLILPGLGTWAAGRRLTAVLQASLAVGGFLLALAGAVSYARELWWSLDPSDVGGGLRLALLGLGVFAAGWLWSVVTPGEDGDE